MSRLLKTAARCMRKRMASDYFFIVLTSALFRAFLLLRDM